MPTPPAATCRWNVDQPVGDHVLAGQALERGGLDDAVAQRDRPERGGGERIGRRGARCVGGSRSSLLLALRAVPTATLPTSDGASYPAVRSSRLRGGGADRDGFPRRGRCGSCPGDRQPSGTGPPGPRAAVRCRAGQPGTSARGCSPARTRSSSRSTSASGRCSAAQISPDTRSSTSSTVTSARTVAGVTGPFDQGGRARPPAGGRPRPGGPHRAGGGQRGAEAPVPGRRGASRSASHRRRASPASSASSRSATRRRRAVRPAVDERSPSPGRRGVGKWR